MANVELRKLAHKELTKTLSREEGAILYAPANRRQWRQELMTLIEEEEGRKDSLLSGMTKDLARYKDMENAETLSKLAMVNYQTALRSLDNFLLRAQKRVIEIDRFEVVSKPGDPVIDFFKEAISEHRRLSLEGGREPEDQDIALWSTLEGEWRFS